MGGRLVAAALRRELPFPCKLAARPPARPLSSFLASVTSALPSPSPNFLIFQPPPLRISPSARPPPFRGSPPAQFQISRCRGNGRPDSGFVRYSWSFLNMIKGKTIAVIGDSLTAANFVPSLLCQISEVTTVKNGSRRTLSGGSGAQYMPPMVAFYYDIPAFGARIVSIWDDYLMRTSTGAYVGGGGQAVL
ncbi:unnamed protein product [Closterium sp. Naga37s-1]|nr:unnamed protein product [Closterium sp. Naga37s-1]